MPYKDPEKQREAKRRWSRSAKGRACEARRWAEGRKWAQRPENRLKIAMSKRQYDIRQRDITRRKEGVVDAVLPDRA